MTKLWNNCHWCGFFHYLNHFMKLFSKLLSYTTDHSLFFQISSNSYLKRTKKNVSHLHIFSYIFWVNLVILESLWLLITPNFSSDEYFLTSVTHLPDAYIRQWTGSSLVQVMACRLFGAKPLPETLLAYSQLDPPGHISMKLELEFYHFIKKTCNWKCCVPKWQPFCPRGRWVNCKSEMVQVMALVSNSPRLLPEPVLSQFCDTTKCHKESVG